MTIRRPLLFGLVLVAASCHGDATDTTAPQPLPAISTTIPPSIWSFDRPADDLVLELDVSGGLRPDFEFLSALPTWAIYEDGSLLAPDPTRRDWILQPVKRLQLSPSQLETINDLVGDMALRYIGVLHDDSAEGDVIDAASTVVTYWDEDGGAHRYSVYALHSGTGFELGASSLAELSRLVTRDEIADAPRFQPDRMQLYLRSGGDRTDATPWPFDVAPADFTGIAGDYRCLYLAGEQAAAAADALSGLLRGRSFELDGLFYQVLARFLLPDHDACGPGFGEAD